MSVGTPERSTADLTLAGRRLLAEACSVVTHRAIESLAGSPSAPTWPESTLPPALAVLSDDEWLARRSLATIVAMGQKLMDPRPLPVASLAELWGCWLMWREALPALRAIEDPATLAGIAHAVQLFEVDLAEFEQLYGPMAALFLDNLPPLVEWFEAVDEQYPVHPYVALTEDLTRRAVDVDRDVTEEDEE